MHKFLFCCIKSQLKKKQEVWWESSIEKMSEIEIREPIPVEGARPTAFAHVYDGRFKDLNQDMRAVL